YDMYVKSWETSKTSSKAKSAKDAANRLLSKKLAAGKKLAYETSSQTIKRIANEQIANVDRHGESYLDMFEVFRNYNPERG
ncbi:MAG: hypothetical protein FWG18_00315, partial [Alphaproteobacteria bacterium]|nr:hypothetical protein [Alphaproteobacteria bacterium]